MSELIGMANVLRSASDDLISINCRVRQISPVAAKDFFDLAESFLKPTAVDNVFSALQREEAAALFAIRDGNHPTPKQLQSLVELFLVDPVTLKPFESILSALAQLDQSATRSITLISECPFDLQTLKSDGAGNLFETLVALDEIVSYISCNLVREVGKSSVGLPEIKRLAAQLTKSPEVARGYYQLAIGCGLIFSSESAWWLSPMGTRWKTATRDAKVVILVEYFSKLLLEPKVRQTIDFVPATDLRQWLELSFPFARGRTNQRLNQIVSAAEQIGLTASGFATPALAELLNSGISAGSRALDSCLPTEQNNLVVQADLTIVAPGPLTPAVESVLRKIAEVESLGYAPSFRMSALSITAAIATGLQAKQIEEFLTTNSSSPLPQPVKYLLGDVSAKFGQIKILGDESSEVRFADPMLAATIANDRELKAFSFELAGPAKIRSRFPAALVYEGLLEAGYPAVRFDSDENPVPGRPDRVAPEHAMAPDSMIEVIRRIRTLDSKLGTSADGEDLLRQIQFAIKNKSRLRVSVETNDGKKLDYLLDPKSVANGRFRGMDKQADIERTLPLSSIRSITFA